MINSRKPGWNGNNREVQRRSSGNAAQSGDDSPEVTSDGGWGPTDWALHRGKRAGANEHSCWLAQEADTGASFTRSAQAAAGSSLVSSGGWRDVSLGRCLHPIYSDNFLHLWNCREINFPWLCFCPGVREVWKSVITGELMSKYRIKCQINAC